MGLSGESQGNCTPVLPAPTISSRFCVYCCLSRSAHTPCDLKFTDAGEMRRRGLSGGWNVGKYRVCVEGMGGRDG